MIAGALILLTELAALFFGAAFLVHIAQRRLGNERVRRWMGGPPVVSALKGIAVGFITPFCTYSAIPMLAGLRQAGVPPAGYVAFIVAAPVLDPILFGALAVIVGVQAAAMYAAVAFSAAMALALAAQRFGISAYMKPVPSLATARPSGTLSAAIETELSKCAADACAPGADAPWRGARIESREAAAAAAKLMRTLGPVLLLGVAIGVGIELLAPADAMGRVAGEGKAFAIPIAAALGTPLYFNTELFVPIANSLAAVGVGIGAIVALTIAGAGANLPEFVILSRLARTRILLAFAAYVFIVAMAGGLLAEAVAA